jgi:hypothetical protein
MDPQETWFLICDALQRLEQSIIDGRPDEDARNDAIYFLADLIIWLRSGGMPPTIE